MSHQPFDFSSDFFDRLTIDGMDKAYVRELFTDAEEVLNSAIYDFVQDYDNAFEQIETLIAHDKQGTLRFVHTIKGLCGTLGLTDFAHYFAQLEQEIKMNEAWSAQALDSQKIQAYARVIQSMREHCALHGLSE